MILHNISLVMNLSTLRKSIKLKVILIMKSRIVIPWQLTKLILLYDKQKHMITAENNKQPW